MVIVTMVITTVLACAVMPEHLCALALVARCTYLLTYLGQGLRSGSPCAECDGAGEPGPIPIPIPILIPDPMLTLNLTPTLTRFKP